MSEVDDKVVHTTRRVSSAEVTRESSKVQLGFWIYLLTDGVLFAVLFATFIILRANTFGGPSESELFHLPFVLFETLLLLTSSFVSGLAMVALHRGAHRAVIVLLLLTFLLGAGFVAMELHEFSTLVLEGNSWRESASLSAFFTLVGTHGLHISFGLVWLAIMMMRVITVGFSHKSIRQLTLFSLYWHFLDIVWIFIFAVVYLIGAGT